MSYVPRTILETRKASNNKNKTLGLSSLLRTQNG